MGVSINHIMNIIFADSFKSESLIIQSIGRGLRLHEDKDVCIIYDLIDCFREDFQKILFLSMVQKDNVCIKNTLIHLKS